MSWRSGFRLVAIVVPLFAMGCGGSSEDDDLKRAASEFRSGGAEVAPVPPRDAVASGIGLAESLERVDVVLERISEEERQKIRERERRSLIERDYDEIPPGGNIMCFMTPRSAVHAWQRQLVFRHAADAVRQLGAGDSEAAFESAAKADLIVRFDPYETDFLPVAALALAVLQSK